MHEHDATPNRESLTMTNSDTQAIEQEARAEAIAAELTPLEWGAPVAWAECRFGRTDGLSVVHRIGAWTVDDARTICGESVAAPILRVVLTPNLVRTLGRCRYCETAYALKGAAA